MTGTKCGCGTGGCGACTAIVNAQAVKSYLLLMPRLQGTYVETIDGLAKGGNLYPLQVAFIECAAVRSYGHFRGALVPTAAAPDFLLKKTAGSNGEIFLEISRERRSVTCLSPSVMS